jgi:putative ABC transport system substrate-binding protein
MDGGGQLTDPVVGRDRPVSQSSLRVSRKAASCLHAIGPVHALFAYPPNGGHLPSPETLVSIAPTVTARPLAGSPRNSERFRSATGTCHRVDGRLMVRQTHREGKPVSGMGRRDFITLVGGAAGWPIAARAQPTSKLPLIGFLGTNTASAQRQWTDAFLQRLRELGWIEGRTFAIEYRWADGRLERSAEIMAELVRLKVDVIVTHSAEPVLAAKRETAVIPIIFPVVADPVGSGVVASLTRPDGNATGLSLQATDVAGKRVEILREVLPGFRRLGIVANIGAPAAVLEMRVVQAAASTVGLATTTFEIRTTNDISTAIDALKDRVEALYVVSDPLIATNRNRLGILAVGARLPTMHGFREHVEAGGLVSYGANFPALFRRGAEYVDKVLRGAKPADLPVEQPTKFDLVISLITAKALGLTIPPMLLARADEVIE